jgi:hypothetical protein
MNENNVESGLGELRDRVGKLEDGLAENTAATKRIETNTSDIIELFDSFKGAMKVLEGIGKLARPMGYIVACAASIAALWTAIKTGIMPK